jgi:hypothetical protein
MDNALFARSLAAYHRRVVTEGISAGEKGESRKRTDGLSMRAQAAK